MGPIRSLTGMIDDVNEQTSLVHGLTRRIREANRRLTGSSAFESMPQTVGSTAAQDRSGPVEVLPTLARLTLAISGNGSAISELREEVAYMESFAETGEAPGKGVAGVDSTYGETAARSLRA